MGFIASLFGYVLNFLYNLVQNYGLAIIIFTLLLKVFLLPLSIKQQKAMKKNAKMQEEMQKLQVKYKNDPQMLNQEVMQLYKREKVSPFSGCLSSILQFVIFISVFYLVSRPLSYMKKIDPEVIKNYTTEITESGESSSYPEIKIIETKSNDDVNVSINMNFLGLDLSKVPMQNYKDVKVFIIPTLYVLLTFVNIKIMNNMTKKKDKNSSKVKALEKGKDDETEKEESEMESMQNMTNSMNWMIPIMSVAVALIAPLGLSLYWLVSNILQLGERLILDLISNKKEKEGKANA